MINPSSKSTEPYRLLDKTNGTKRLIIMTTTQGEFEINNFGEFIKDGEVSESISQDKIKLEELAKKIQAVFDAHFEGKDHDINFSKEKTQRVVLTDKETL